MPWQITEFLRRTCSRNGICRSETLLKNECWGGSGIDVILTPRPASPAVCQSKFHGFPLRVFEDLGMCWLHSYMLGLGKHLKVVLEMLLVQSLSCSGP